ncbi:MAG: endo alpha-1,4 polygalactosaminidase [Actinomycetota bacterium]
MRRPAISLALFACVFLASANPAGAAEIPDPKPCPGCWQPDLETSWQWQLTGTIDLSFDVEMYDVDLFDTPASAVDSLHDAGRRVICYTSAGSRENWRPDAGDFPSRVVGRPLDGWPGERWLDIRKRAAIAPVILGRLDLCAAKGFDGVEFDNVDAWSAKTGFPITRADQLRYNVFLANAAHDRGLSAALKNDVEQVNALLPYFDFALNEECFTYRECDSLEPFVDAGKPVFQVEYDMSTSAFCPKANAMNFNSLKKKLNLGAWRLACR